MSLDWIGQVSLEQLKAGFTLEGERYTCLCCGQQYEQGIIYPDGDVLYEAGRYVRLHIEREHGSVFEYLLGLDKSATGLSEVQRGLLALFYQGKSDAEIQTHLGMGSTSTVRNHRFMLKEKERQAKVFLALMELLRARDTEANPPGEKPARSRRSAGVQDPVLKKYFPYAPEGPLKTFAMKESDRLVVLTAISDRFARGRRYSEQEVNEILEAVYADYATLRRYLVDYNFMNRLPDGSQYWRSESADSRKGITVDRKAELKRLAKETKTEGGVYQIKNNRNGKLLVEATRNFKTINGKQFELENGSHMNKALQQEWNQFGKEAFTFEVLEVLEKPETGFFDEKDALAKLHTKWLTQLQPYGERGYNSPKGQ